MSRILLTTTLSILMQLNLVAQTKWGFENYQYLDDPGTAAIVPVLHFETAKNLYTELRYNYESPGTLTLLAGKSFAGGKNILYSITPMTGFSAGTFTGIDFSIEADFEWKKIYFTVQAQRSVTIKKKDESFFFNWSELQYLVSRHFSAGVALQYTLQAGKQITEPGLVAALSFRSFSFPCYLFNPFHSNGHVVLGLNYEGSFLKKGTRKYVAHDE
ncbi:MAG: hypothetical protein ABIT05_08970 [Chitinophagaceae bacterium]